MVGFERAEDGRERRREAARAQRGTPEFLARVEAIKQKERGAKAPARSGRRTPENSSTMFGHSWPDWFAMRDAALEHLCRRAAERRLVGYGEVWHVVGQRVGRDIGNHWRQLRNLLGSVSERSADEFGLLASALVVYDPDDESSGPGPGFFKLAVSLGLLERAAQPDPSDDWAMTERQRAFWREHVDGMFARFAI